jgi:hypothetical protein
LRRRAKTHIGEPDLGRKPNSGVLENLPAGVEMEVSELIATGFTVAMACASLALVAARGRRKLGRTRARRQKSPPAARASVATARDIDASEATVIEMQAAVAPAVEAAARDAPAPDETWIILKNDQEIGPVKRDELTSYVRQGLILETDLLKPSSSKAWMRAGEVAGLFPAAAAGPGVPTLNISLSADERLPAPAIEPAATPRPARAPDTAADWAKAVAAATANQAETPGKAPSKAWGRLAKAVLIIGALGALAGLAWIAAPQIIGLYQTYRAQTRDQKAAVPAANPFEFTLAGIATSDLTEAQIETELLKHPAYVKIREIDPAKFESIAQTFRDGLRRGVTGAALIHAARPLLNAVYAQALPYASADDLIKALHITVETAAKIRASGSPDCYFYLHETKSSPETADAIEQSFPAEIGAEWALKRQVFESYKGKNAEVIGQETAFLYQNKILAQVRAQFGDDTNLLFGDNIPADKYSQHCAVAIAYYGEILKLPPDEAVAFFRYLLLGQ